MKGGFNGADGFNGHCGFLTVAGGFGLGGLVIEGGGSAVGGLYLLAVTVGSEACGVVGLVVEGDNAKNSTVDC